MEYQSENTKQIAHPDIINIWDQENTEVLRIAPNGDLFWKGREIETDEEFKTAMSLLAATLMGNFRPVGKVEKYTGSLKDMSVIVWAGEQPPEGTILYAKEQKTIQ